VDARANYEQYIALYKQARTIYASGPDFAKCLQKEGFARRYLADLSVDVWPNLEQSIAVFHQAGSIYASGSDFAGCLVNEGLARQRLMKLGKDARPNLEQAIALFSLAGSIYGHPWPLFECQLNEGVARLCLADLSVDPRPNLDQAIALFERARPVYGIGPDLALCLTSEGVARRRLADLGTWRTLKDGSAEQGVDARSNLEQAIALFRQAAPIFETSPETWMLNARPFMFANCLLNEGLARQGLAHRAIDVDTNLEQAIALFSRAGSIFASGPDLALSLTNERLRLLKCVDPRPYLEQSIAQFSQAGSVYVSAPEFALCLQNEGEARLRLGNREQTLGNLVDARANYERVMALYQQARTIYGSGPDFANCLLDEGCARRSLAEDLGVDPRANLEQAITLFRQAAPIFRSGRYFDSCLANERLAKERLANLHVDAYRLDP
jgi:tetratricopeptide (TPR) repeat protein